MSEYESAMSLYDQSWRHYHNRKHINDVHQAAIIIRAYHTYSYVGMNTLALHRAIDLHDIVYTVGGTQNEEASALVAESYGYKEAARLIRLTQHHQPDKNDQIGQVIVDADLYGLAFDYQMNGLKIQTEVIAWCKLQDIQWKNSLWTDGRKKWLESFLDRPQIFYTEYMRQFDDVARDHMTEELSSL
jgi:predicted metal-dependent HD superfamily phosphohydrolase